MMSRATGFAVTELEELQQSVADILTTPIGTRLMRRPYGSDLLGLVDQLLCDATAVQAKSMTVIALRRRKPRLNLTRIRPTVAPQCSRYLPIIWRTVAPCRRARSSA